MKTLTLVVVLALLAVPAYGQDSPSEPDGTATHEDDDSEGDGPVRQVIQELFLGELVYPQERFELQVTSQPAWAREGDGENVFLAPLTLEFGITERIQLDLTIPHIWEHSDGDTSRGVGNVELGVLCNVFSSRRLGLAVSTAAGLTFRSVSSNVGEDDYSPEFVAIFYKVFGPLSLNVNLGVEAALERGEGPEYAGLAALGMVLDLDPVFLVVEADLEVDDDDVAAHVAMGLVWHPANGVELGVGVPVGLTAESTDLGVIASLTIEFGFAEDDSDDD